ncbi:MAG: hypothetical protein R3F20_03265 [Planctomycetota bacterium]
MRGRGIAAVLLAFAAVGLAALVGRGCDPERPRRASTPLVDRGKASETDLVDLEPRLPAAGEGAEESRHARPRTFVVQVVDFEEAPVVGALVSVRRPPSGPSWGNAGPTARTADLPDGNRTDTAGRLELPLPDELLEPGRGLLVEARIPGAYGSADAPSIRRGDLVTIRLAFTRSIAVRVEDGDGQGVSDVLVLLDRANPAPRPALMRQEFQRGEEGRWATAPRGWTDAEGMIRFDIPRERGTLTEAVQVRVVAAIEGLAWRDVVAPWPESAEEAIVVAVDAPARHRFRLREADGASVRRPVRVEWRTDGSLRQQREIVSSRLRLPVDFARDFVVEGGEFSLRGLSPGDVVRFRLDGGTDRRVMRQVEILDSGSTVDLVVGPEPARLTFDVLTPEGRPFRGDVFLRWSPPEAPGEDRFETFPALDLRQRSRFARLRAPGSFEVEMTAGCALRPEFFRASGTVSTDGDFIAAVELPPLEPGSVRAVGPFRAASVPLAVAGRVSFESGRPAPGVSVILLGRRSGEERLAGLVHARTDLEGRFEIRADRDPAVEEWAARAASDDRRPATVPIAFGDRECELVFTESAAIRAHILGSDPELLEALEFTVQDPGGGRLAIVSPDFAGRVHIGRLSPGPAVLVAATGSEGAGGPPVRLATFELVAGETLNLGEFDIDRHFRYVGVEVERPCGLPAAFAKVELISVDTATRVSSATDLVGRARFVVTPGSRWKVRATSDLDGWEEKAVIASRTRLRFLGASQITAAFSDPIPPPPDGSRWELSLIERSSYHASEIPGGRYVVVPVRSGDVVADLGARTGATYGIEIRAVRDRAAPEGRGPSWARLSSPRSSPRARPIPGRRT